MGDRKYESETENIEDREAEMKKMLPTYTSLNVEKDISNTTETNQFVHDTDAGYKILKPPEPVESLIGKARPTSFDLKQWHRQWIGQCFSQNNLEKQIERTYSIRKQQTRFY